MERVAARPDRSAEARVVIESATFQVDTPRLILRDFVEEDWSLIREMADDPAITRYQTWLRLNGDRACREWVAGAIDHNNRRPRFNYNEAIVLRSVDRAIGWLGWGEAEDPSIGDVSFGYALLPEGWSHGYMTEAVQAMLAFVFGARHRDFADASCDERNRGSARVLEKSSLRLVARETRHDDVRGEYEHLGYLIMRSEWERFANS